MVRARFLISGFAAFAAIGIVLLAIAMPAGAAVKVLQYNPDGTVKGVTSGDSNGNGTTSKSTKSKSDKSLPSNRYVEGELVVINPPRNFSTSAGALGFKTIESKRHASLKLTVIRVRTPSKYSVSEAKDFLASKFSRLNVDANHIYDITGTPDPDVMEYLQLAQASPSARACGKGVRIGMIDSGINVRHPALAGRNIETRSFISKGLKSGPTIHGTAIAGMFVANLPAQKLVGYLPAAQIKAANVQEVGPSKRIQARASNILNAIDWLVKKKVHVINFNIAGADNRALAAAVKKASKSGVIMVAAVGNWGSSNVAAYPAAYKPVIGVSGVDKKERRYSRANKGPYVDFSALAVQVWTAATRKGGQFMSGTSFATPLISSLVALEVSRGGEANPRAIRTHIKQYTIDIGKRGKDNTFGWGLVQKTDFCK